MITITITITNHEKSEWSRFAQAAYARGDNATGHRFSAAASLPTNAEMTVAHFDSLQRDYRAWLVFNEFPCAEPVSPMTYAQAIEALPAGSHWSSSFGCPGEGGYVEYHRTPDQVRYKISNGRDGAVQPFTWQISTKA